MSLSSSQLISHLHSVFLELANTPYPDIPNPPTVNRRASVALVIRIQPDHAHWPPPQPTNLQDSSWQDVRQSSSSFSSSSASDPAAVRARVAAFFAQDWVRHGDPEVLFIKRAARPGDRWTSHVALPGGRRDPGDADDRAAAVRECAEEVGLDLSGRNAVAVGNLPQRVVTTSWGKVALMVLCPYVFLLVEPNVPPLNLQPTEVASAHWVSLRALLSPRQRTVEYQDVSNRLAKQEVGVKRWFLRMMLGRMLFAAIRLIPSESKYCSTIADFVPQETPARSRLHTVWSRSLPWWFTGRKSAPSSAPGKPLLLWGLTLGVAADFLELLPPHNALELWTYPTFTPWDVRLTCWAMSYPFRTAKARELGLSNLKSTTLGDAVNSWSVSTPPHEVTHWAAAPEEKPGEVGRGGLGIGSVRNGSRPSGVSVLIDGYYEIVRRAVKVALVARLSTALVLSVYLWRRLRGRYI